MCRTSVSAVRSARFTVKKKLPPAAVARRYLMELRVLLWCYVGLHFIQPNLRGLYLRLALRYRQRL